MGNPSSSHGLGKASSELLSAASSAIKKSLNATNYEIVWTSGGTEADAMVLGAGPFEQTWVGAGEHAALLENLPNATTIELSSTGRYVEPTFQTPPPCKRSLLCLGYANSETGVVQPIAEYCQAWRQAGGGWVHVDGVQAAGRLDVNIDDLGVDSFALAAHKFGGVPGIGALLVRNEHRLSPQLLGGGQQHGSRPGTLQLGGPMAMAAALECWSPELRESIRQLRDQLESDILARLSGTQVIAQAEDRLPNTIALRIQGCPGDALLMALDVNKVSISTGSACSSGSIEPSKALLAMGLSPDEAREVIRISLGPNQTQEEMHRFVDELVQAVSRARSFR